MAATEEHPGETGPHGGLGRRQRLLLLAFLLLLSVCFLAQAPSYARLVENRDMGSQLSKGQQILFGLHPYLEIDSSVYGPAIFYLSALAQLLGGGTLLLEILLIFAGFLVSYLLLLRVALARTTSFALVTMLVLLALASFPRFHKYHILLPAAVVLYGLHRAGGSRSSERAAVKLAVAATVAGLLRIDFGLYAVLTAILFLWLHADAGGWRLVLRSIGVLLGTGLLLVSPWLGFLMVHGDLPSILRTSMVTGSGVVEGLQTSLQPYDPGSSPLAPGNFLFLSFWFFRLCCPLVALVAALELLRPRWWAVAGGAGDGKHRPDEGLVFLLTAAVFGALVYLQACYRVDLSHVKQSLLASALVLVIGIDRWLVRRRSRTGRITCVACLAAVVSFLCAGLADPALYRISSYAPAGWWSKLAEWRLTREEAFDQGAVDLGSTWLPPVIGTVRQLTTADDAVLFIPFQPQAYYYAGRHFDTPFGWLNPGRFLEEGAQARFIKALDKTKIVVDERAFSFDRMPSRNARAYAPAVMQYLYTSFGALEASNHYVVLARDPQHWATAGRFPLELHAAAVAPQPMDRDRATDAPSCPWRISHVNTLPLVLTGARISMPQGAGLLITALRRGTALPPGTSSTWLALVGDGGSFVVTEHNQPAPLSRVGPGRLIATRSVPAGTYRLVLLTGDADELLTVCEYQPSSEAIELVLVPASTCGVSPVPLPAAMASPASHSPPQMTRSNHRARPMTATSTAAS